MARRAPARAALAAAAAPLLVLLLAAPAAAARALQQSGSPCGGPTPTGANKRGIRLALTPDPKEAYGASHITIANIDLNNPSYNGNINAARRMIKRKCSFGNALKPQAASTELKDWKVDDWKTTGSDKTYVMTITNPKIDKWASCLGSKVPGVYGVVGPNCAPNTAWHNTFYGLFYPMHQVTANGRQTDVTSGKAGRFRPYLVENPANEGVPKGSNGQGFIWTKV